MILNMDSAIVLALIGILGSTIATLFKLLDNNTKAVNSLVETNDRMARESKERNGHLAEIAVDNKNQIMDRIDGMIINKQTVHHQTVEHEQVLDRQ
jgi:hypothetical protein